MSVGDAMPVRATVVWRYLVVVVVVVMNMAVYVRVPTDDCLEWGT